MNLNVKKKLILKDKTEQRNIKNDPNKISGSTS
jgi:hypothetical protein